MIQEGSTSEGTRKECCNFGHSTFYSWVVLKFFGGTSPLIPILMHKHVPLESTAYMIIQFNQFQNIDVFN